MKPIRYIVGGVGFLLVWFVVAVVIGVVMALIFPVPGEQAFVGIDVEFDLESRLALFCRRIGAQERRAVLIYPEIRATFFLIG